MADEMERRRISPVHVVEHEEHGLAMPDLEEKLSHRRVEAVTLGVRIGADRSGEGTEPGRQVREEPRELAAAGPERAPDAIGLERAHQELDRLDDRLVGRVDDRVGRAVENEHASGSGFVCQLSDQARLAAPGLAAQECDASPVVNTDWEVRRQRLELRGASHEGEGGCERERAGKNTALLADGGDLGRFWLRRGRRF